MSDAWTTSGSNIYNNNSGNVGIGTTTPYGTLAVQSTSQPQFNLAYNSANTDTFSVSSSGALTIAAPSQSATTTLSNAPFRFGNAPLGDSSFEVSLNGNGWTYPQLLSHFEIHGNDDTALEAVVGNGANSEVDKGIIIKREYDNPANENTGSGIGLDYQLVNNAGTTEDSGAIQSLLTATTSSSNTAALAFLTDNAGSLSEKLRITGVGNVGIGTTSPDDLLSLYSATKPALEFSAGTAGPQWTEGIDTSNGNSFEIASSTALGTNPRFVINGSGNVGIGTTNPSQQLDVLAASTSELLLENTTAASVFTGRASPQLKFNGQIWNSSLGNKTMSGYIQLNPVTNNATPTLAKLSFFAGTDGNAPTEEMSISSQGTFNIAGGANFAGTSLSSTGTVAIENTAAATPGTAQNSNELLIQGQAWNSSQGNISQGAYLQLLNSVNNANPLTSRLGFFTQLGTSGGGFTENVSILNTGNVGIGTTSPLARLDVAGANNGIAPLFQLSSVASFATTTEFIVNNNGNATLAGCLNYNGGTSGTCLSDERVKQDINPFTDSLQEIVGLDPVTYE